jgi:hypothetical protein
MGKANKYNMGRANKHNVGRANKHNVGRAGFEHEKLVFVMCYH